MSTQLILRNVVIDGRRTSLRLESEMWMAMDQIAALEGMTIHQLCSRVANVRRPSSLTSAIRVFLLAYFRRLGADTPETVRGVPQPARESIAA